MISRIKKIKEKLLFPLHIHISMLFIVMIVVICSVQIYITNKGINQLLLEATSTIFDRISTDTRSSIRSEYRPAFNAIAKLSRRDIVHAETVEQRNAYFTELAMLLDLHKHVSTYRISFPNGDWFGVGILGHSSFRTKLNTPENAYYFFIKNVSAIENKTTVFFYDDQSRFIQTSLLSRITTVWFNHS